MVVDIREYYEDKKTGEEKASGRGIALEPDQYTNLVFNVCGLLLLPVFCFLYTIVYSTFVIA